MWSVFLKSLRAQATRANYLRVCFVHKSPGIPWSKSSEARKMHQNSSLANPRNWEFACLLHEILGCFVLMQILNSMDFVDSTPHPSPTNWWFPCFHGIRSGWFAFKSMGHVKFSAAQLQYLRFTQFWIGAIQGQPAVLQYFGFLVCYGCPWMTPI